MELPVGLTQALVEALAQVLARLRPIASSAGQQSDMLHVLSSVLRCGLHVWLLWLSGGGLHQLACVLASARSHAARQPPLARSKCSSLQRPYLQSTHVTAAAAAVGVCLRRARLADTARRRGALGGGPSAGVLISSGSSAASSMVHLFVMAGVRLVRCCSGPRAEG